MIVQGVVRKDHLCLQKVVEIKLLVYQTVDYFVEMVVLDAVELVALPYSKPVNILALVVVEIYPHNLAHVVNQSRSQLDEVVKVLYALSGTSHAFKSFNDLQLELFLPNFFLDKEKLFID